MDATLFLVVISVAAGYCPEAVAEISDQVIVM